MVFSIGSDAYTHMLYVNVGWLREPLRCLMRARTCLSCLHQAVYTYSLMAWKAHINVLITRAKKTSAGVPMYESEGRVGFPRIVRMRKRKNIECPGS